MESKCPHCRTQVMFSSPKTPLKTKMEPEIHLFETKLIFQTSILGFHVCFRGSIVPSLLCAILLSLQTMGRHEICSQTSSKGPNPITLVLGQSMNVVCFFWIRSQKLTKRVEGENRPKLQRKPDRLPTIMFQGQTGSYFQGGRNTDFISLQLYDHVLLSLPIAILQS